jgi:proteasome accessory factor B
VSAAKLERLLNLTALLLAARLPVPAEQIQEQLDYPDDQTAFRRAFERDKDELRSMGIPLRVERVPGRIPEVDGYRIPPDEYALRDPGLSSAELAALHLAASAVQVEGMPATGGLLKLGGLVPADAGDLGVSVATLPADPNLSVLFAAVAARTTVRLHYRERDREVDPYRLEFLRGRWYLTAHDHSRGEERNFRLERIEGAVEVVPGPAFDPPEPSAAADRARGVWALGAEDVVTARVRIEGPQAQWAMQHVGPDHVVSVEDDGAVTIELPVTNRSAFRSFVLGFLEHAEVLSPPELRAEMVTWLTELAG